MGKWDSGRNSVKFRAFLRSVQAVCLGAIGVTEVRKTWCVFKEFMIRPSSFLLRSPLFETRLTSSHFKFLPHGTGPVNLWEIVTELKHTK